MTAFWQKPLEQLTEQEWEALCDGCGRCCLHKLQNDLGELFWTSVACRLLDLAQCRCTDYANRMRQVPTCLDIRGQWPHIVEWLPATCAYRLRHFGEDLSWWHPLLSGDPQSVVEAGVSVRSFAHSEQLLPPGAELEAFILDDFD